MYSAGFRPQQIEYVTERPFHGIHATKVAVLLGLFNESKYSL